MHRDNITNRVILPVAYLSSWLALYLMPRRIFSVGGDNSVGPWFIFGIVFLVLPALLRLILIRNGIAGDKLKGIVYGSVFLAIPFGLVLKSESKNELEMYGIETVGIIDEAWIRNPRKRSSVWSVKATYYVKGKEYHTSTKDDVDRVLKDGDTVTVIYSLKTPEMSQIKDLIQYYGN